MYSDYETTLTLIYKTKCCGGSRLHKQNSWGLETSREQMTDTVSVQCPIEEETNQKRI